MMTMVDASLERLRSLSRVCRPSVARYDRLIGSRRLEPFGERHASLTRDVAVETARAFARVNPRVRAFLPTARRDERDPCARATTRIG